MDDRAQQQHRESPDEPNATDRSGKSSGNGADASPTGSLAQDGVAAAHGAEQNLLLRTLPVEVYGAVLPHLDAVRLELTRVLIEPDTPIRDVYFVREGVVSFISDQQEHGSVEVGTIGRDGFIGIPASHAPLHAVLDRPAVAVGRLQPAAHARRAMRALAFC